MYKDRKNLLLSVNVKVGRIYINKSAMRFLEQKNASSINIISYKNQCLLQTGDLTPYHYQGSFYIVNMNYVSLLMRFFNKKKNFTLVIQPTELQTTSGTCYSLAIYDKSTPRIEDTEVTVYKEEKPKRTPVKRKSYSFRDSLIYHVNTLTVNRILRTYGI